ncbi:hypothetical protein A0O28_0025740 [Trichoderma guizhouense]|uniref:Uncharacterized protein n=1 Tax=Trichoderma guizhouense TaxID=1491466 RepID=A0A1T3CT61_9HYPO|nr:hypothetical protein A0O28_0025740 [Trichoderma guizhouense]
MEDSAVDAAARPLRIASVVSFVPSFALCIAHGVLSHNPVPAVGLVPQAVSVVTSIALLRTAGHRQEADVESIESEGRSGISIRAVLTHPIVVFIHDVVLAAALMIVLIFTWTHHGRSASLSMLAAYATLPILTSFFCHLFAAALAVYQGFAIHGLLHDAPLLAPLLAEDDPERYRDDPEDDVTPLQPEAVEVRSKRNRQHF